MKSVSFKFSGLFRLLGNKKLLLTLKVSLIVLICSVGLPAAAVDAGGDNVLSGELSEGSSLQQNTVTGVIKDDNGEPIPGVTVLVKGTNIGTLSDIDGKYSLPNVPQGSMLVFSFIGLQEQEIAANRAVIDVVMTEGAIDLDEIVVIGYGTQRKQEITGAVASVKEDDFNKGIIINPEQLLQGKVSGVNITSTSGEPGAAQAITIRGPGSVRGGSGPLYVVDGVPLDNSSTSVSLSGAMGTTGSTNPLNFLNASDIKSMEVLKDASSTAIYGSRGANGVIIITTKTGSSKESFSFNSSVGISTISQEVDVLTAEEYRYYNDLYGNSDNIYPGGYSTNWQDQIFRTGITYDNSFSFSGGTNKSSYYASVSALNQDGIVYG